MSKKYLSKDQIVSVTIRHNHRPNFRVKVFFFFPFSSRTCFLSSKSFKSPFNSNSKPFNMFPFLIKLGTFKAEHKKQMKGEKTIDTTTCKENTVSRYTEPANSHTVSNGANTTHEIYKQANPHNNTDPATQPKFRSTEFEHAQIILKTNIQKPNSHKPYQNPITTPITKLQSNQPSTKSKPPSIKNSDPKGKEGNESLCFSRFRSRV